jgi:hypothetical protein
VAHPVGLRTDSLPDDDVPPDRHRVGVRGEQLGRAVLDPFDVLEDGTQVRAHGGPGPVEVPVEDRPEDLEVLRGERCR